MCLKTLNRTKPYENLETSKKHQRYNNKDCAVHFKIATSPQPSFKCDLKSSTIQVWENLAMNKINFVAVVISLLLLDQISYNQAAVVDDDLTLSRTQKLSLDKVIVL